MIKPHIPWLLRVAALLTLVALGLMVWSVVQPTPLPTILAMSLGQVLGTTAFAMYLLAIVIDLRRDARAKRRAIDQGPPPPPRPEGDQP